MRGRCCLPTEKRGHRGSYGSIFAIPKNNVGFMSIINLRNPDTHILYKHFKMDGLDVVRNLLQKGDWLAKLDLKDAYLTVSVYHTHQPFLRFRWKGSAFQFTCLAFGFAPASRAFTKLSKPVMAALRSKGGGGYRKSFYTTYTTRPGNLPGRHVFP